MCTRTCFNKIFWAYTGFTLFLILLVVIFGSELMENSIFLYADGFISIPANIILIYGVFSRTINMGYSIFMVLLVFIPIVNFIYLFMLLAYKGTLKPKDENI